MTANVLAPSASAPKGTRRAIGTILCLFFVAIGVFALLSPQALAEPDANFGTGRRRGWGYTKLIALVVENLGAWSAVVFFAIAAGVLIWTYRDLLPLIPSPSQHRR